MKGFGDKVAAHKKIFSLYRLIDSKGAAVDGLYKVRAEAQVVKDGRVGMGVTSPLMLSSPITYSCKNLQRKLFYSKRTQYRCETANLDTTTNWITYLSNS